MNTQLGEKMIPDPGYESLNSILCQNKTYAKEMYEKPLDQLDYADCL